MPQEQGGGPSPGTSFADFDLAYNPINAYEQGSKGGMYSVQSGDTLAGIAAALWGDANLWYKIAEANGLTAESALLEGMSLIIPAGVQSNANNAATFKPYDPLEVLGSTSPTSPAPKKQKCGAFGQVLLAVIAIAVSVVAGPVAGSIVSQSVGVATGIQDKFSWNAVGLAWVSSFIAGPIGSATGNAAAQAGASALTQAVVSATVSNVVTQGIGVATGLQKEFSWAGVAAAGVAAGVGHLVGNALGATSLRTDPSASEYHRQRGDRRRTRDRQCGDPLLIDGTDFGDNIMAALPDVIGQTIGEAIAGGIASSAARRREARAAEEGQYAGLEYGLPTASEVLAGDPATRQPILDLVHRHDGARSGCERADRH